MRPEDLRTANELHEQYKKAIRAMRDWGAPGSRKGVASLCCSDSSVLLPRRTALAFGHECLRHEAESLRAQLESLGVTVEHPKSEPSPLLNYMRPRIAPDDSPLACGIHEERNSFCPSCDLVAAIRVDAEERVRKAKEAALADVLSALGGDTMGRAEGPPVTVEEIVEHVRWVEDHAVNGARERIAGIFYENGADLIENGKSLADHPSSEEKLKSRARVMAGLLCVETAEIIRLEMEREIRDILMDIGKPSDGEGDGDVDGS